jgi:RNase H-fold protein (predicted Holliday junction resolvase)
MMSDMQTYVQNSPIVGNIEDFIQKLGEYKKSEVINIATKLLWDDKRHKNSEKEKNIISAFAHRILILIMATDNRYRTRNIDSSKFIELCKDYTQIKSTILDENLKNQEAEKILEYLKGKIPDHYLKFNFIRHRCGDLFISRKIKNQNETSFSRLYKLYRWYHIFSELNDDTVKKIFNMSLLDIFRSCFALLCIGKCNNGHVDFSNLLIDETTKSKLNIDQDTLRLLAYKISYDEEKLRSEWYEKEVLSSDISYQQFHPTPLYKHPIIHRKSSHPFYVFLIPSPDILIKGFINFITSEISDNYKLSKMGDILESHIFTSLKSFSGIGDRLKKIDHPGKKADFHIELDECHVIIECKSRVGSYKKLSLMTPKNISEMWGRLYEACKQCSKSANHYRLDNYKKRKPIIAIILVGDDLISEGIPFQNFSIESGLLEDLKIDFIDILSWDTLEYCLSKTSVKEYFSWMLDEKILMNKIKKTGFKYDEPAHSYEHLRDIEEYLKG